MISRTGGMSGMNGGGEGCSGTTGGAGCDSTGGGGASLVVGSAVVVGTVDVVDSTVLLVVDVPWAVTVCVTHLMARAVFQITLRSSRIGEAAAMRAPVTARTTEDLIVRVVGCDVGEFFVLPKG
jgi:hypothetical protein